MEFVNRILDWEFMNEPIWRWFVWMGALAAMTFVWRGILSFVY